MIPGPIGIIANAIDAIFYMAQGDWISALTSLVSALAASFGGNLVGKIAGVVAGVLLTGYSAYQNIEARKNDDDYKERESATYIYMGVLNVINSLL